MDTRTLTERRGRLILLSPQRAVARMLTLLGADQTLTISADSNSSVQRQPAATDDSAYRSHDPRQLGICPA